MTLIQHVGLQLAPHFYVLINYSSTNEDHDAVRDKKTKANVKVRFWRLRERLEMSSR